MYCQIDKHEWGVWGDKEVCIVCLIARIKSKEFPSELLTPAYSHIYLQHFGHELWCNVFTFNEANAFKVCQKDLFTVEWDLDDKWRKRILSGLATYFFAKMFLSRAEFNKTKANNI